MKIIRCIHIYVAGQPCPGILFLIMDSFKRFVGTSILSLARFLDTYFYHIAITLGCLGVFNYFFIKNYDQILLKAAKEGNIEEVKEALRYDADVNTLQNGDCTPLMIACASKHEDVIKFLLETEKCKVDTVDSKGRSALLIASAAGLVDSVKLLLKHKADAKSCDNNGNTALIAASLLGHAEVVKCLLAFNSEPRWKNKQGVNALAAAVNTHKADGDRLAVMKELLSYSFKKNLDIAESRNAATGWTPIIRAAYKGHTDVVKLLLEYNADIAAKGRKGFTALIAASQNGWKETVELLLERGADPTAMLEDGSTALIAASFGGYHEIVDILAKASSHTVNARFKNGSTPLMTAALNGYISVVRVLLEHKADVNAVNDDSWGALAVAAQKGCVQIVTLLLQANATVDTVTDRGFTPLMLAIKSGHCEVVRVLVEHGALINHFELDPLQDQLSTKKIPLYYGYLSPLMLAINSGKLEIVSYLLEHEADLFLDLALLMSHCEQPRDKYTTEEHERLKKLSRLAEESEATLQKLTEKTEAAERIRVVNLLRDAQIQVESSNRKLEIFQEENQQQQEALRDATLVYSYFSTPLLFAVYWNNTEIVRVLLKAEAGRASKLPTTTASTTTAASDPSPTAATTISDATPTTPAQSHSKLTQQCNAQGLSAIQLAADYYYPDTVLLLLEYGGIMGIQQDKTWRWMKFLNRLLYHWQFITFGRFLSVRIRESFRPAAGKIRRHSLESDSRSNATKSD